MLNLYYTVNYLSKKKPHNLLYSSTHHFQCSPFIMISVSVWYHFLLSWGIFFSIYSSMYVLAINSLKLFFFLTWICIYFLALLKKFSLNKKNSEFQEFYCFFSRHFRYVFWHPLFWMKSRLSFISFFFCMKCVNCLWLLLRLPLYLLFPTRWLRYAKLAYFCISSFYWFRYIYILYLLWLNFLVLQIDFWNLI